MRGKPQRSVLGFPIKRHRKMPQERLACFGTSFILRHFQPAVKKALRRSALIQGKAVAHSLNYYRFLSYDTKHRREGVSDKEKQLRIAGSVLLVRDQENRRLDNAGGCLYTVPSWAEKA